MDRYVTVKQVGKGSYGAALLVKLKIDPSVLLVIKRVRLENAKERVSAQQEVKMLAQLSHPNVVGYVDSFFHANYLCIVTEYCQGGDMYNRLKACKTHIPEEQVLDWLVQTARALAHLHGKRIMHRDLKTQNIFLTKDGVVRLGDFGIARALNAATEMAVTVVGTPFYMSPELMASKPYDFKTDMWSLGCVLYEMTSLQHAFCADDMSGLVLKILRGAYDPPPACYSQGLRDLVGKLLSKEPDARPDAETLLADPLLAPRVAAASAAFDADSAMHVKTMDDLRLLAAIPPGGRGAAAGLRAPRRSGVSPPHRVSVPGAPAPPLAPEAAAELGRIKARIARDRDERRALEANIRALEGEAARLRSSGGADVSPPRRVSVAAPPAPPRQPSPPVAAASAAERVAAARKAYAAPGRISQAGAPAARVSQAGSPPRVSVSAQAPQRPAGALHGGIPVAPVPAPAAAAGGPASQALLDQIAAEREELRLARLQLEERAAAAEAKAEAAEAAAKATAAAQAAAPAAEPKSRSASPPQRVASLERARALALAEDAVGSSVPDDDDYRVACEEAKDRVGDFSDDLGGPAPMPRARRGSSGDAAFGGAAAVVPEVRAAGAPRASAGGAARLPRRSSVEAFLERRARASAAGTGDDVAAAPSAPTLPVPPPRPPTAEEVARSRRASEPGPAARTASPPAARAAAAAARAAAHPGAGSAALAALRAARREGDDDSYSREASPPAPRMSSPQRTPGLPPRAAPPAARVSEAGCGASELMRLRDMHASISRRLKAMRAVVRDAAPDAPADPDDAIEEEDAEVEDDDDEGGPAASFDDSGDGDAAQADAPAADAKARPALGAKFGAATLLRRDVFTEGSTAVARAAALRAACDEGLGGPLFVRVYDAVAAQSRGAGASAADDAAFRARLRAELGPDREHFLGLVDRLLFEEEQAFS